MTTTSLSERYVWAVTRQLPAETGPDVARELRGTLAESVEDRIAAGQAPEAAEHAAVAELGDPDVLAREYGGRPNHLIGPGIYPDYVRLMRAMLVVVLPIVAVATLLAQGLATDFTAGGLVGSVVWATIETGVHLVFWTTLVFWLIERGRSESERDRPFAAWDPDSLTSDEPRVRAGTGETVLEIVFSLAVAALVAWQFAGVGDRGVQVLDPGLDVGWKALIVGLFFLDAAVALVAWRRGWSLALAAVNVLVNLVSAVVLVWLLYADRLLTDLPSVIGEKFDVSSDWTVSYPLAAAIIVIVCGWDAVTSIVRAHRARRATA